MKTLVDTIPALALLLCLVLSNPVFAQGYQQQVALPERAQNKTPATTKAVELISPRGTTPYYAGVEPYVLFAEDLETFRLNQSVREVIEAIAINADINRFVTMDAALSYVETNLSQIEGMTESLVDTYLDKVKPLVALRRYQYISSAIVSALISNSKVDSAAVLNTYVNQLIPYTLFRIRLKSALEQAGVQNDELRQTLNLIDRNTLETTRYHLINDEATMALIFPSLDQSVAECMVHWVDAVYPSAYTFSQAIENMLLQLRQAGLQVLQGETATSVTFDCVPDDMLLAELTQDDESNGEAGTATSAPSIASRQCAVMENAENEPSLLLSLEKDQCPVCATKSCLTYKDYMRSVIDAVTFAAKKPYLRGDLDEIHLQAIPECRECALPLEGVTYGFYPYWLASGPYRDAGFTDSNPAYLNFSLFTRMAYFALPIDDNGKLKDLLHWNNPRLLKQFVQTLNQFNVKRDIVLYSGSWESWSSQDDVKVYAENHYNQLKTLHNRVAKYGGINGVTLYFDHYRRDTNPASIITYVTRLFEKIAEDSGVNSQPWLEINLMLGVEGLDSEANTVGASVDVAHSYFAKLETLFMDTHKDSVLNSSVEDIEKGQPQSVSTLVAQLKEGRKNTKVSHLLVFLNESTSNSKKRLRLQIENEFKGEARVDALEKVIPILGRLSLGEESQSPHRQFMDDIAYLKYNFGGLGFWNLPLTTEKEDGSLNPTNTEMQILSHTLKMSFANGDKNYINTEALGLIGATLLDPSLTHYISVCGFACPHRAWTLPILWVLLVANVLVYTLYRTHCPSRTFIQSNYILYMLLKISVVLLMLVTFGCDPALQGYSKTIVFIFIAAIFGVPIYRSFMRLSDRVDT